jgi:nucleolar protein 14
VLIGRQLASEAKGRASDRTKTPEELAKQEREKLEALEKQRQARMRGEVTDVEMSDSSKKSKVTGQKRKASESVDSLDENYKIAKELRPKRSQELKDSTAEDEDQDLDNADGEEEEEEEDDGEESTEHKQSNQEATEDQDEDDDEDAEGEEKDSDFLDALQSWKEDDDDLNDFSSTSKPATTGSKKGSGFVDVTFSKPKPSSSLSASEADNIPFTFDMPESYEELASLLDAPGRTFAHKQTILQRILVRLLLCACIPQTSLIL